MNTDTASNQAETVDCACGMRLALAEFIFALSKRIIKVKFVKLVQ